MHTFRYIRFCKLYQDDSSLIVGGESPNICIWDVNVSWNCSERYLIVYANLKKQTIRTELTCDSQACYALVTTPDGRMCFSCCADGNIVIWDLVSETKVAALNGHVDGASCVDIFPQDMVLWTGGLDRFFFPPINVWTHRIKYFILVPFDHGTFVSELNWASMNLKARFFITSLMPKFWCTVSRFFLLDAAQMMIMLLLEWKTTMLKLVLLTCRMKHTNKIF